MRLRTYALLALLPFTLVLASSAYAVPILVELRIKDPVAAIDNSAPKGDDAITLPGKSGGKGNSNEKGKGGGSDKGKSSGSADLHSLTLWLSADGKVWKPVTNDVLEFTSDKITARLDTKGDAPATDLMKSFGLPSVNITGELSQNFYVGLSTSSTSYVSGSFSARLVSWQYVSPNRKAITAISVPEQAILPLFATGAVILGLALGGRKKS